MDQQYWSMFFDFKLAEYYYQMYAIESKRWKTGVSIACALSSAACVTGWASTGDFHIFWAIIIMASQLISVLQPFFPYDKRLTAARYIHRDITTLCTDTENAWFTFTSATDDDTISQHIINFRNRYNEIESRFADTDTFPVKRKIHKEAEKSAEIYFRRYYQ